MGPEAGGREPEYTKYRARPRWRLGGRSGGDDALASLRDDSRGKRSRRRRGRRRLTVGRAIRGPVIAVVAWIVLSLVLFVVSAQVEQTRTSGEAQQLLAGGFPLLSKSTILVLGSDARVAGTHEAGAEVIGQPSRSDSILLIRTGGGAAARLSIPRDNRRPDPRPREHEDQRGLRARRRAARRADDRGLPRHQGQPLVEVDFANFPSLINALGGIDYKGGCVVSKINGGFKNGGYTLRLTPGTHHLNGKQALALARTRKNECNPAESDLTRARRQQKIFSAMKSQLLKPTAFLRLPWIGWDAPKAIHSDMGGPSLMALFASLAAGGTPPTHVLQPSGSTTLSDGESALLVSDSEKQAAVRNFLKG